MQSSLVKVDEIIKNAEDNKKKAQDMKNTLLEEQRHQLDKLQNAETMLDNAAREVADLSERHQSLKEQFLQEKNKSSELESQLDAMDRQNKNLQKKLQKARANNQEIQEELEEMRVKSRALDELVGKLQAIKGNVEVFELVAAAAAQAAAMTPRQ